MRRLAYAPILSLALVAGAGSFTPAWAQRPRPKVPPKETPAPPVPPKEAPGPTPDKDPAKKVEDGSATSAEALEVVAGGLTADQAAQRAASTSPDALATERQLDSLSAKADLALYTYIPRLDLLAQYTRLSTITPPEISPGVRVPVFFNLFLAQATLTVPFSDYFLKIPHNRAAAVHAEEAGVHDVARARAKAYFDGKSAYYNWLRSKAAVSVAEQSLIVARAHAKDSDSLFNVGKLSKAEVLRAQTEVASAELVLEKAKAGAVLAERQLRVLVHARDEEVLHPGESLDTPLSQPSTNLKALLDEAATNRPELKNLELTAQSAHASARAARAGRYPSLSGFADLIYANPNARRFPQQDAFFPSWDAGVKLTWSPNDAFAGGANAADAEARAAAAEAKKVQQRDAVDVEVVGAVQDVMQADVSIKVSEQQMESATEGHRVARELFLAGRLTSTALIDSEQALAQSRFNHLNARVDARVARIRLDYVVGRIAKVAANGR